MRLLTLLLPILFLAHPVAAQSTCAGQDLISALTDAERAPLDAAVARAPYPQGNHWRATKGERTLHLVGTLHLFDPRMTAVADRLAPLIADADKLFVEATDAEMKTLQKAIAETPDLIFTTGPTLPEQLTPGEWAKLSDALRDRGIPPFLASKFRPWYLSVLLALPPCAMAGMGAGSNGLDRLVMDAAAAQGKPMESLEAYDTIFRAFNRIAPDDQLNMIRTALPTADRAEDMLSTMIESYFREDHRQIWEFSRLAGLAAAGDDRAKAEADFALMEEVLINERNRAWVEKLLADDTRTAIVAVGAGHFAGDQGLLKLLESAGFTVERQAF